MTIATRTDRSEGMPGCSALPRHQIENNVTPALPRRPVAGRSAGLSPLNDNRPSGEDGRSSAIGVGGFEPPTAAPSIAGRADAGDPLLGPDLAALTDSLILASRVCREAHSSNRSPTMKTAAKAAGAIAALIVTLATTAGLVPRPAEPDPAQAARGYATGKECWRDRCQHEASVAECILCCNKQCTGWLEPGCQDACFGGAKPGLPLAARTCLEVARASARISARGTSTASAVDIADVDFIVAIAARDPDPEVRHRARVIGLETPIVSTLLRHTEQGDVVVAAG